MPKSGRAALPRRARCGRPCRHAICDRDRRPAQGLWRRGGGARHLLLRRRRGGLLPPRPQRRGQDHHDRDPRGLPRPQRRRGARARPRPRGRRAGAARARRHRPAGGRRPGRADGGRGPRPCTGATTRAGARSASSSSSSAWPARRAERVKLLSGGQRRRLDLALALVGDPDLLFLDEPTTGFDPSARRQAWTTIKDLCALGKTVFLTTHYMDEAQALADRVAVMVDGRIVALGTPAEIGGRDTAPTEIALRAPRPRRPRATCRRSTARDVAETAPGRVRVVTREGLRIRPRSSPAGRSSAATSCAASPSASPRWRTSTFD